MDAVTRLGAPGYYGTIFKSARDRICGTVPSFAGTQLLGAEALPATELEVQVPGLLLAALCISV
jgi:hypothetical protein